MANRRESLSEEVQVESVREFEESPETFLDEGDELADVIEEVADEEETAEVAVWSREAADREMDATRLYLGEIGFSPLLTAEDEVFLSRRAQRVVRELGLENINGGDARFDRE